LATANNHVGERREEEEAATSMEGNSAAAFVGFLRGKLQPGKGNKHNTLSWNLGIGYEQHSTQLYITSIISQAEMLQLSQIYFRTLHECYDFLDVDDFNEKLLDRWEKFDCGNPYDPCFVVSRLWDLYSLEGGQADEKWILFSL
jgi:hypothetical protein